VTETTTKETVKIQRKDSRKAKESQGMGKKHYFELLNKINELDTLTMKRIMPLEFGLENLLKESKDLQYLIKKFGNEINNKCKCF
jgi:hypothetical protein